MNILAFKHGRLSNIFETLDDASRFTEVSIENILALLHNGKESSQGYSFDLPIPEIHYIGFGCEDERNLDV